MKILKKALTILLFAAFIAGVAVAGDTPKDSKHPSASIHIEEWQVMAMASTQFGHGTVGFNGHTYKFKVTGLGIGGVGVHKLTATGNVYHLNNITDFPGVYFEARAGFTLAKGKGGLWLKNDKGVTVHLKTSAEGLALALGADGMKFSF